MDLAIAHFASRGYSVEDVSLLESFDLRCTRGDEPLMVEVKGTSTLGEKILLTRNEVREMRMAYPRSVLVVVHSINLTGSTAEPLASGGELVEIAPWHIAEERLTPLTFSYDVLHQVVQREQSSVGSELPIPIAD